jgi:hypothetical protein
VPVRNGDAAIHGQVAAGDELPEVKIVLPLFFE